MTWEPPEDYSVSIRMGASYSADAIAAAYGEARSTIFSFSERLLLRHILILGTTGSGKTTHACHVIRQALEVAPRARCFIIDVKKEYRDLATTLKIPTRIMTIGDEPMAKFNPLAPPKGVKPALWDRAFADVFIRAYGLSEPSRHILLDSLAAVRQKSKLDPTVRQLERQVAAYEAGSKNEQGSQRSLESRLHGINTGPVGDSLNSEQPFDPDTPERLTIFEIGFVDSMRDQKFLAELVLMHMWQRERVGPPQTAESLRRLILIEEAHRYLSEDRPQNLRGERTLLELAIAEARRYGWGFVIIDQMPLLLSRYVWDNMGTIFMHRVANMESYKAVKDALGRIPVSQEQYEMSYPIAIMLPEDLAIFRRYLDPGVKAMAVGIAMVKPSQPSLS